MRKYSIVLIVVAWVGIVLQTQAQSTVARFKYEDAEKAFYNKDYQSCISLLDETEKLLGKSAPNILYLKIMAQYQLFRTNPRESYDRFKQLRNNCQTYLTNYDITGLEEKYREVYEISNQLPKISNQEELAQLKDISPTFNYENHKGGKSKLEDFNGKHVYIDLWATWCGPCIKEIPSLKQLYHDYKGKIEFISIAIDPLKDYEKWKSFVTAKSLEGTQLFADNSWDSNFLKGYKIKGIPRFIIIAPDRTIIDANAPRPSSPEIRIKFDKLLKVE